jgi:hypothetical protein
MERRFPKEYTACRTANEVWAKMAKVKMQFVLTWKGTKAASLFYLMDGGMVVPLTGKKTTGKGKIVVSYLSEDSGVHFIEWGLAFPDKKLSGFKASASISGGAAQDLASKDDEQEDKWTYEGEAVG